MVAPAWVVQHPHSARERDATNRAHGIFGLPPGPTKGQAQQVPGLDRHVRVVAWPAPPTSPPGRVPGRERLRRDPDREAVALLECPVVLWPVADLVARPGDLVAARLIGLVGHRASGKRGSGPIRSTLAQPKPKARNFAPTPHRSAWGPSPRFDCDCNRRWCKIPCA